MRVFINRVTVTGYLTHDPKLECLPSGASMCKLSIGCSTRRRDRQTGEWYEKPNFFDVVVFGGQGETVARFMRKGRPIAVDGKLDWRHWETVDGRRAHDVSIVADTVQFLGDPPRDGEAVKAEPEALEVGSEATEPWDVDEKMGFDIYLPRSGDTAS